ncbi:MAG: thioredoxin-dependent thiol peroxidase [Candidatus Woesearchaeota archaeon]|jgi:peroxiredoxin Q/BCP|nr:thioredoxin-dependent thiol peroxidase [Candidatus Woesearchaeota archaeon]
MVLEQGKAPNFTLKDKDGKEHSLHSIEAKHIVLYFYPKDNTPGCTIQAIDFTNDLEKFQKLGVEIIGVSGGDETSKAKFCEKHDLNVLLVSDPDFTISKKYDVAGPKNFMGRLFQGITRTTFILDKDKNIVKVYKNVKAKGHADELLEYFKE